MEGVVGVLKGVRGRTFDTVYDLFFTDKRIVAAILVHPSDFKDIYGAFDLGKVLIGGSPHELAVSARAKYKFQAIIFEEEIPRGSIKRKALGGK